MKGQLQIADQAIKVSRQHTSPCIDCPWARKSLAGWLGSVSPIQWIMIVLGEAKVECHTRIPMQCAGAAIFRANICKVPRDPDVLRAEMDKAKVFSSTEEFQNHHENGGARSW